MSMFNEMKYFMDYQNIGILFLITCTISHPKVRSVDIDESVNNSLVLSEIDFSPFGHFSFAWFLYFFFSPSSSPKKSCKHFDAFVHFSSGQSGPDSQ